MLQKSINFVPNLEKCYIRILKPPYLEDTRDLEHKCSGERYQIDPKIIPQIFNVLFSHLVIIVPPITAITHSIFPDSHSAGILKRLQEHQLQLLPSLLFTSTYFVFQTSHLDSTYASKTTTKVYLQQTPDPHLIKSEICSLY